MWGLRFGFWIRGLGSEVWDSGQGVQGSRGVIQGLALRDQGLEFGNWLSGSRI